MTETQEINQEKKIEDQLQQLDIDTEDIDDVDLDSIDINKYKLDDEEELDKEEDQPKETTIEEKDQTETPADTSAPLTEETDNTPRENIIEQSDNSTAQSNPDALSSRSSSSSSISSQFNSPLNTSTIPSVNAGEKFNQNVYTNTGNWSQNVSRTVRHLHDNLHEASRTTLDYVKAYKLATEQIHDTINQNVVSVHQLVTKAQQLNEELRGVEMLHQQVKETKKLLGFLEDAVNNITKVPRK
eukprot:TRINITY_DN5699_c0_g1_i1.p1 TRINITY_DN5699_c0_g1~~TRINITY_DN5699_c0_g1_i1.p1  ORF type:complete len:257 (-),score=42.06 TRINITY_DN5699_c0_g1_i1:27-752(-)